MSTLSADELADIRLITGTDAADITASLTDARIQLLYDTAVLSAPDSDLVLPYTYVYVLRRALGFHRKASDRRTDHGDNELNSQKFQQTKDMLDYWEGVAGLSGVGVLSFGIINLDLDEDDPNES